MDITPKSITIRDLTEGFKDSGVGGVTSMNGTLDIRPAYQREFVYKDHQRDMVIDTVLKGRPLNVMYWAVRDDGTYEVMDGQQRTISICQYVDSAFSIDPDGSGNVRQFSNLTGDLRDRILDYELMIYVCEGTDSEKLDWFRTINIAGEKLTDQELRNAVYTGPWLSSAKAWFSKTGGPAADIGNGYVKGVPNRQELLERALTWAARKDALPSIEAYMAKHQHDANANALTEYYESVLRWAKNTFPVRRKELSRVDWAALYDARDPNVVLDADALEKRVAELMSDEDVSAKHGIYPYVLGGKESLLSIRAFTPNQKREAYERQQGICPVCGKHFELEEMQADHITPWSKGGRTVAENCKMLCADDNRKKSNV